MRASAASAREPRGERTLIGIGPEFIRREMVANGVSGAFDGVPTERMDRTPSSPIVVEQHAVTPVPSPTIRMPVQNPERTMRLSVAPSRTVELPLHQNGPAPGRSTRLDSFISGRFFQEGEVQEANGWEDSPLAVDPLPEDLPPRISSFDRIPRHRAPLIVTTFILSVALVLGLAVHGAGAGAARAWLASEAGRRAMDVWNRAKSGLAMRLTPESTAASARAMAAPTLPEPATPVAAAPAAPSSPLVVPEPAPAAEPAAAEVAAQAPPVASASSESVTKPVQTGPRPPVALAARPIRPVAPAVAEPSAPASLPENRIVGATPEPSSSTPAAPASIEQRAESSEPQAEPRTTNSDRQSEQPRRGMVWSPAQQRLVPAQPASMAAPAADSPPAAPVDTDKNVLPLDEEEHTTY
jgi:hypothetical protein